MVEKQRSPIQVKYQSLEKLKPNPKNAKSHSAKQIKQIESSINEFGFLNPVVVDPNGVLIAGHARFEAAKRAGLLEIPTVSAAHLSEAQKIAFAIADNRLTENGSWNEQLLAENFKLLADADLTFDLEITGFEVPEIDLLLQLEDQKESAKEDPADDLSGCSAAQPVCKMGDLWQLGAHRVLCGSSLDESSYEALMEEKLAAMIFTDPPYNVPIAGFVSGAGSVQHREFAMAVGEMTSPEFHEFLQTFLTLASHRCKPGAIADLCMDSGAAAAFDSLLLTLVASTLRGSKMIPNE